MTNELIEIYVRTDVDIYTDLEEACRDMWLTVGPTLHCFTNYLLNWPKIIFQVSKITSWTIPLFFTKIKISYIALLAKYNPLKKE